MRICFWVSSIASVGGVQRVTSLIASELSNENDIYILTEDSKENIQRNIYDTSSNIQIIESPNELKIFNNLPLFNKIVKRINKITGILNNEKLYNICEKIYIPKKKKNILSNYFNKYNFDYIVGVQGDKSLLLASVSKQLKAKTIGWQHSSFDAYFKTKKMYFWNQDILFKKNLPNLDKYIVLNEHDSKKINETFGINSTYIYNPFSFKSNGKTNMENKYFIAAGRFCTAKGFDIYLEAIKRFVEKKQDWKFFLIGDGEKNNSIQKIIREYNLSEYVITTGYVDNIQEYFSKSSVFVLSSRWEGMPMVALESLAMGCPIISFDISAMKPIVENMKEGIIVEFDETGKNLSEAMLKLSNNVELRKKMQENALKKSKVFSMDNIIKEWKKVFNSIKKEDNNEN